MVMLYHIKGREGCYDSRYGSKMPTVPELYLSSRSHIADVHRLGMYIVRRLQNDIGVHDFTKMRYINEFHDDFEKTRKGIMTFQEGGWYQSHILDENHHLFEKPNLKGMTLTNVICLCLDWVASGIVRSDDHKYRISDIPKYHSEEDIKELLYQCFLNTLDLLVHNSRLKILDPSK